MSESHGLKGCGNHGCLVQPVRKGGMGTNAICQCVRRDGILAERMVQWLRSQLVGKDAEVSALKARLEALGLHADELAAALNEAYSNWY